MDALTAGLTRPTVPRAMFLAGIFFAFAALLGVTSRIVAGDGATPPPPGDTQDYDNIAVQLLRGRGFAIDYSDSEWRRPYERHNPEGDFDEILARKVPFHFTTQHAPVLPFALAVTYRLFGRDFLTWRIVQAILIALALALVCDVAWRALGPRVALMAAALMFLSATYLHDVAYFALLPEPLAILFVAVMVWALSRAGGTHPDAMALVCGIAAALLCLTRTAYVAWLPLLAALIWWMSSPRGTRAMVIFTVAAIVIQAPWWIRNIRLTGTYMPTHAAYVDSTLVHDAVAWRGMVETGLIAPVFWLAVVAPFVLWRLRGSIRGRTVFAIAALIAVNLVVIVLTETLRWRFLVPVEPLLTVLAAVPVTSALFGERAIAMAP